MEINARESLVKTLAADAGEVRYLEVRGGATGPGMIVTDAIGAGRREEGIQNPVNPASASRCLSGTRPDFCLSICVT